MRILISGAAGFIGSRLAIRLLDEGHKVLGCDNMATGLASNIDPRMEFIESGAESDAVFSAAKKFGIDHIAHIGGNSSGEVGEMSPLKDVQWSTMATVNLGKLAETSRVRRFVYASSMGVYGQNSTGEPFKETDCVTPLSIYGASKLACEGYLNTFARRGLSVVSLRMFNVYGPGQNLGNTKQGMVSIYMEQLLRSPKVVVRGSLQRVRDFVYIDDVVDAWCLALRNTSLPSGHETINVATGVGHTVEQLLEELRKLRGTLEIELSESTPAVQQVTVADVSKARAMLGWAAQHSLAAGLKKFWEWGKCQNISR